MTKNHPFSLQRNVQSLNADGARVKNSLGEPGPKFVVEVMVPSGPRPIF